MKPTLNGRVSSLETVYTEVIKPMRADLRVIRTSVQKMSLEMSELLKRTNEHHDFIKVLKVEGCPRPKVIPDNNRKHNGRKLDQKKYKILVWSVIVSASGIILALLGWLGSVLIAAGQILESVPK